MSQISQSITTSVAAQQAPPPAANASDPFNELGIDQFLGLLIAELQNQDPLSPTENSDIVAQIGQIRTIGATDQLTNTLASLSANQELVTASSLIDQQVTGLADDGTEVRGIVDRITVETNFENDDRSIRVHVDGRTIDINNIREILTGQTLSVEADTETPVEEV